MTDVHDPIVEQPPDLAGFRRAAGRDAERPAVTDPASGRTRTDAELAADVAAGRFTEVRGGTNVLR